MQKFARIMPHIKFILPTAPTQPVTMNMGAPMPSWYDITGLDERSNEKCPGIEASCDRLSNILRSEHEATKLPYSRMLLAGFSQGGALSLWTGLQGRWSSSSDVNSSLAGIVLMSAYIPAVSQLKIIYPNTPIRHFHGSADPLVTLAVAKRSQQLLTDIKGVTNYDLKVYPGLSHSVSSQELEDVLTFIRDVLPPNDAYRVVLKDPSAMSVKELKAAIRRAGLSHKAVGFMEKQDFVKLLVQHRSGDIN
jgi:lysophospholipase II